MANFDAAIEGLPEYGEQVLLGRCKEALGGAGGVFQRAFCPWGLPVEVVVVPDDVLRRHHLKAELDGIEFAQSLGASV